MDRTHHQGTPPWCQTAPASRPRTGTRSTRRHPHFSPLTDLPHGSRVQPPVEGSRARHPGRSAATSSSTNTAEGATRLHQHFASVSVQPPGSRVQPHGEGSRARHTHLSAETSATTSIAEDSTRQPPHHQRSIGDVSHEALTADPSALHLFAWRRIAAALQPVHGDRQRQGVGNAYGRPEPSEAARRMEWAIGHRQARSAAAPAMPRADDSAWT